MGRDSVSGLLCRPYFQKRPHIVYFSLPRRPEGGENYPITPAIIALWMAAVNMGAGVRVAVGGQVLMQMKWQNMCVTLYFHLYPTLYVHVSRVPAGQ